MADGGGKAMVCVAQVGAPHGVRGAFRLRCFTEAPENVAAYGPLCDERGRPLFEIRIVGPAKDGVIATAPGIADRDAAEALRGKQLYVPRDQLPATDEDEYYHEDLVGLEARDLAGRPSAGWWRWSITAPAISSRSTAATAAAAGAVHPRRGARRRPGGAHGRRWRRAADPRPGPPPC